MKTLGQKIKELRNLSAMTQRELAEKVGINVQSLGKYESGKIKPKDWVVVKLAELFDVSTDYLLGVYRNAYETEVFEKCPRKAYYKAYLDSKNNYVLNPHVEYYWIFACGKQIGGQTKFVGWQDKEKTMEKRRLCVVEPDAAVISCTETFGRPMIVNELEEVAAFLTYGGHAIVEKTLCEQYLHWYLEDYIVEANQQEKDDVVMCGRVVLE